MPRLALALVLLAASPAAAATWTVLPMQSRGVEPDAADTFRALLVTEIARRNQAQFVDSELPCADVPCAQQAGRERGADVAVFGTLNTLGQKIIVIVTAVDVATGAPRGQERMTVDRVEDLEAASVRLAEALTSGRSAEDTAELGTVTAQEQHPDRRKQGDSGLSLRLGGVTPVGGSLDAGFGLQVGLGFWYEARDFAIEPRVRIRGSTTNRDRESWTAADLDLGVYYILGRGDFAPYVGGGAGLRWLEEQRVEHTSLGSVVSLERDKDVTDDGSALGTFVHFGVLLFRTYSVRTTLDVEYDVTFSDLFREGSAQSIVFGIGVIF